MVGVAGRGLCYSVACLGPLKLLIIWLIVIGIVCWSTYSTYMDDPKYFYIREILGIGLFISRSTASVVNVSSFVAIIPMCRLFMTYLRICGSRVSAKFVRECVDNNKAFHIICAFTILIAGCVHSVAHTINSLNFSLHYNAKYKDVNVAKFKGEDPLNIVLHSVPGITGILMIVTLCILFSSSMNYVRNTCYDLFWFTHHLFIVFFILLLIHPMSGLLKQQVNLLSHPPGCFMNKSVSINKYSSHNHVLCAEAPAFISETSGTWKWVFAGLIMYIVDLSFRFLRRKNPVEILDFQIYNCNVIYLSLSKKGFTAKPGQFVFLQCPDISRLEWHPFSISKCPSIDDSTFTIHLRTLGDWSDRFKHHLTLVETEENVMKHEANSAKISRKDLLSLNCRLYIDGPYGSCFEDILNYSVGICIAGGIGFTPFASILNYLRVDAKRFQRIRRLHFLWICREPELYKCFSYLLYETFQLVRNSSPDKFELHLYFTNQRSWHTIEEVLGDSYPFLKPRIQFGKPRWKFLFEQWGVIYKKTDVGLFCCGPQTLNENIRHLSQKWNTTGCHFSFHEESF